jgi:transcriptional regulator with XRE-family HTH domain
MFSVDRSMESSGTKLIEVGNNIRKWRSAKGMKQECLADILEISAVALSKIETGKTDIPLKRLFQIASVLGLKVELLFQDPFEIIKKGDTDLKV